ncbi:unnamed protein product, partial [Ectocarpus sp. 4 AP-2014]
PASVAPEIPFSSCTRYSRTKRPTGFTDATVGQTLCGITSTIDPESHQPSPWIQPRHPDTGTASTATHRGLLTSSHSSVPRPHTTKNRVPNTLTPPPRQRLAFQDLDINAPCWHANITFPVSRTTMQTH